jgi:putative pyruvate formate lyase activating enzyme
MNNTIENELSTYIEIMLNKRLSRSKVASLLEKEHKMDMEYLWEEHENIRLKFKKIFNNIILKESKKPNFSYLDLKIEIAEKIFGNCYFCEKRCYSDRNINKGECEVLRPKIASEFMHMGEEAPIIPSHTIFFSGCNFECIYCQNFDISQFQVGVEVSEYKLAQIIDKKRMQGSKNVNFVGGDPTPNLPYILKVMQLTKENIPVIWNSNFFMSEETMKILDGFVDLYLSDFKYGPSDCAEKLSGVKNYWKTVKRNHLMAKESGDMIIRHLVLPEHVECCSKPILKWISKNLGNETVVNIMGQYRPVYRANESSKIMRYPSFEEMNEIKKFAYNLGLKNII